MVSPLNYTKLMTSKNDNKNDNKSGNIQNDEIRFCSETSLTGESSSIVSVDASPGCEALPP
jgi:hypothetical protein